MRPTTRCCKHERRMDGGRRKGPHWHGQLNGTGLTELMTNSPTSTNSPGGPVLNGPNFCTAGTYGRSKTGTTILSMSAGGNAAATGLHAPPNGWPSLSSSTSFTKIGLPSTMVCHWRRLLHHAMLASTQSAAPFSSAFCSLLSLVLLTPFTFSALFSPLSVPSLVLLAPFFFLDQTMHESPPSRMYFPRSRLSNFRVSALALYGKPRSSIYTDNLSSPSPGRFT
mmetsp:Transcript_55278/g.160146  ORF Transcript_55278/g.160146 Transcript_55278/m.160146 type:complete len:224 (-) Transcript_55278:2063-2734(-)